MSITFLHFFPLINTFFSKTFITLPTTMPMDIYSTKCMTNAFMHFLGLLTKSFSSMCHALFMLMTYHLLKESSTNGILTSWDHIYNIFTVFPPINAFFSKTFITLPTKFFLCLWTFILPNVMNTILDPILVCLVEWNISVPADFGVPFMGVSGFLKNNFYIFL